jgi:hypothetical protein
MSRKGARGTHGKLGAQGSEELRVWWTGRGRPWSLRAAISTLQERGFRSPWATTVLDYALTCSSQTRSSARDPGHRVPAPTRTHSGWRRGEGAGPGAAGLQTKESPPPPPAESPPPPTPAPSELSSLPRVLVVAPPPAPRLSLPAGLRAWGRAGSGRAGLRAARPAPAVLGARGGKAKSRGRPRRVPSPELGAGGVWGRARLHLVASNLGRERGWSEGGPGAPGENGELERWKGGWGRLKSRLRNGGCVFG